MRTKTRRKLSVTLTALTVCAILSANTYAAGADAAAQLRFTAFSKKNIVETAAEHNGSLLFKRASSTPDIIHIIALRVEFNGGTKDSSTLTTGNGLFSIRNGGDKTEIDYYNSDTVYKYDALPHDSAYFDHQLNYVKNYYNDVSHGKMQIEYSIYPPGSGDDKSYKVALPMTAYGPGAKKKEETYSQYNERVNVKLIRFIKDALLSANNDVRSPFTSLKIQNNAIVDDQGHRCVFLIIHAGSSYLTDGGANGSSYANTPSDMIDAFISKGYFDYYKDTLQLDSAKPGIAVKGKDTTLTIDEIMMVSETSNQDGLNFGIHGILVNQFARQIGIPDLYATSSGVTAVGQFCIMDFYGYSAGQGFIPPWPSAWVRAFMGWDTPVVSALGQKNNARVKAVCAGQAGDTTTLMVPINDHEYYLLENRQRSLIGGSSIFNYDTTNDTIHISSSYPLNLKNNASSISTDPSHSILRVKNYDASLPASGVLVWHIDENIIRDRIKYDYLNADSSYRAVSLMEADGVQDIGVAFQDAYYNLSYDAGGAEDVFPHTTVTDTSRTTIDNMSPWTKPSTNANDGGKTYLKLKIDSRTGNTATAKEVSAIRSYFVKNMVDTFFNVNVDYEYLAGGWPKHVAADSFYEPVTCDLYTDNNNRGKELVVLSKKGWLYVLPSDTTHSSLGDTAVVVPYTSTRNQSLSNYPVVVPVDSVQIDTVHFYTLPGACAMPTVINNKLFVPSRDSLIYVVTSASTSLNKTTFLLPHVSPSTYVCKLAGKYWAVGTTNGKVYIADTASTGAFAQTITIPGDSLPSVNALAALPNQEGFVAAIQSNGRLSICSASGTSPISSTILKNGIPPYTLVTGDIDHDDTNEIVISDSRKGIWVYKESLVPASGWRTTPNDWPTLSDTAQRSTLPVNTASPALADLNNDGCLDIIVGGFNGVYALNYKGNLLSGWPAYLDNRYNRGNVTCSPVIMSAPAGKSGPLTVFMTPTGKNATFEIDTIISSNKTTGIIVYKRNNGDIDSLKVTASFIDSAITLGGNLISPYVLPGGLIDAVTPLAKRPTFTIGKNPLYSYWPFTAGSSIGTSPILDHSINNDSIDMYAVSQTGWIYRWQLDAAIAGDSLIWKQAGFDNSRPFAYMTSAGSNTVVESNPISFFSYPNPTNGSKAVAFKYKFKAPAANVRLDIFTYTGYHVFSNNNLSGSYPDWNELSPVSLSNFASGVYRCRFEATVGGKKYVQYWKMAVVK